jgi:phosphoribosyl-dephospho-CoA transferase
MPSHTLVLSEDRTLIRRHDLAWLDPARWEDNLLTRLDPELRLAVRAWFADGYPVVARRRDKQEPEFGIAVGIPLSPQRGGQRVALCVASDAIRCVQRPPRLKTVLHAVPPTWNLPLKNFAQAIQPHVVEIRVYGSLMWQCLTREPCLHAGSDIDFLLEINNVTALPSILRLLQRWEQEHGLQADGEVLLRDGRAVAWRELAGAHARVLVKSLASVELMSRNTVMRLLHSLHS